MWCLKRRPEGRVTSPCILVLKCSLLKTFVSPGTRKCRNQFFQNSTVILLLIQKPRFVVMISRTGRTKQHLVSQPSLALCGLFAVQHEICVLTSREQKYQRGCGRLQVSCVFCTSDIPLTVTYRTRFIKPIQNQHDILGRKKIY